jgi:hypothetical protein
MRPEAGVLAAAMLAAPSLIRAPVSELAGERIGEHALAGRALLDKELRTVCFAGVLWKRMRPDRYPGTQ